MQNIRFFENYIIEVNSIKGALHFRICSKGFYDDISNVLAMGGMEITECRRRLVSEYFSGSPPETFPYPEDGFILKQYINKIDDVITEHWEQLRTPECSSVSLSDLPPCTFESNTIAEKMVAEYAGISILQVQELNYLVFRLFLADAIKYNLGVSEKGIEWLNAAKRKMLEGHDEDGFNRKAFLASLAGIC